MKKYMFKLLASFSLLLLFQLPVVALTESNQLLRVQSIIDSGTAPEGVVFEIVNRDTEYLDWALKEVEVLTQKLHIKYPHLDIAIVSHGPEQFALMDRNLNLNVPLKTLVMSLVNKDIDIHVCGTYAEYKGVDPVEFSKLVNVSAEGPAQLSDYIKLGYVRIKIIKNMQ